MKQDPESILVPIRPVATDYESTSTEEEQDDLSRPQNEYKEGVSERTVKVIVACSSCNVFLSSLDSTLVSTLLGVIASDLKSMQNISWVATSYLLSCAAFQPLFGKISDIFGRKSVILVSTALFAIGCFMCSISRDLWTLVAARFITGIGGGGMNAMATITVSDVVPLRRRGEFQGYINVFFYVGAILGGIFAGVFQAYIGWRMAFFVQVPICAVTGFSVYKHFNLPPGSQGLGMQGRGVLERVRKIDYVGSFFLVVSLFGLMLVFSIGGKSLDLSDPKFLTVFFSSLLCLFIFYIYDLKIAADPIIPVRLLHNRSILASCLCCWFISMNIFSCTFYLPFYWISVKNLTPLQSGLRLIPSMIASSLGSISAGQVIKKTCSYSGIKAMSGVVSVLGSILVYLSAKSQSAIVDSLISVPLRWSTSAVITTILVALIAFVSEEEQALVTSIQYCFRSTGSTLGVSLSAAILQMVLVTRLEANFSNITSLPPEYTKKMIETIKKTALQDPSYAFSAPPLFKEAILAAYDSASHATFIFLIGTALIAMVCIFLIENRDVKRKGGE